MANPYLLVGRRGSGDVSLFRLKEDFLYLSKANAILALNSYIWEGKTIKLSCKGKPRCFANDWRLSH